MSTLRGRIRGKTIELEQESGLPDGQAVAVAIQLLAEQKPVQPPAPPASPPWWLGRLDVDPTVRPGRFVIKGTRLEAEALVALLEQGWSEGELVRTYPDLTPEDVTAVREYATVPLDLRRSFGAWAEDAEELDRFLEWNRQQRKVSRRRTAD